MIALLALLGCGSVREGVAAFERGDLPNATAAFEAAAETGEPSGVVWYDLGTTWYLRGDLPRAVACWRSAARLRPRDADVQHDLAVARVGLPGTPPPVGEPQAWMRLVTTGELGIAATLLTVLGSVGLVRARRAGRSARASALTWVVGLALGGVAISGARAVAERPVAVVVDRELKARVLADPAAAERFRLPPGSEVAVERRLGDWALVRDGRDRRGWVGTAFLHLVTPGSPPPSRAPDVPVVDSEPVDAG